MSILLLTMGPNLSIMADIPAVGVGSPGVIRFRATGAAGPVKWTLVNSTLPAEWDSALNPDGNAVTLTTADAETAGTFSVTVRAVDNARIPVVRSFEVRVMALPLTITGAFPEWFMGLPATGALTISGGMPPYSGLTITSGALPSGVSLSIAGNQIVASGTPTVAGSWAATLRVSDSAATIAEIALSGDVEDAGDPYWSSVVSLMHFDGVDGSTTFTDESGKSWARTGPVEIDTSHPKFGTGAGLFSDGYLHCTGGEDFSFGTDDFTLEFFLRGTQFGTTPAPTYLDNRFGTYGSDLVLYTPNDANHIVFFAAGGNRIITASISNGEFHHIALCRGSGVTRLFVNGVQSGADYADTNNYTSSSFRLGASLVGGSRLVGHIDEFRITKGVARYTEDFDPPISPFPNSGPS